MLSNSSETAPLKSVSYFCTAYKVILVPSLEIPVPEQFLSPAPSPTLFHTKRGGVLGIFKMDLGHGNPSVQVPFRQ